MSSPFFFDTNIPTGWHVTLMGFQVRGIARALHARPDLLRAAHCFEGNVEVVMLAAPDVFGNAIIRRIKNNL